MGAVFYGIDKARTTCKSIGMIRSSLILLSILTACFKDETVSGQTDGTDIWVLKTMNELSVAPLVTISFPEEGRIAGQAPCNRYFANQTVPLPWFEVEGLGSTKMACPELATEVQYFDLLQKITTAEITGDTLILKSDNGQTLVYVQN
jgi:heat shock protein HslJ